MPLYKHRNSDCRKPSIDQTEAQPSQNAAEMTTRETRASSRKANPSVNRIDAAGAPKPPGRKKVDTEPATGNKKNTSSSKKSTIPPGNQAPSNTKKHASGERVQSQSGVAGATEQPKSAPRKRKAPVQTVPWTDQEKDIFIDVFENAFDIFERQPKEIMGRSVFAIVVQLIRNQKLPQRTEEEYSNQFSALKDWYLSLKGKRKGTGAALGLYDTVYVDRYKKLHNILVRSVNSFPEALSMIIDDDVAKRMGKDYHANNPLINPDLHPLEAGAGPSAAGRRPQCPDGVPPKRKTFYSRATGGEMPRRQYNVVYTPKFGNEMNLDGEIIIPGEKKRVPMKNTEKHKIAMKSLKNSSVIVMPRDVVYDDGSCLDYPEIVVVKKKTENLLDVYTLDGQQRCLLDATKNMGLYSDVGCLDGRDRYGASLLPGDFALVKNDGGVPLSPEVSKVVGVPLKIVCCSYPRVFLKKEDKRGSTLYMVRKQSVEKWNKKQYSSDGTYDSVELMPMPANNFPLKKGKVHAYQPLQAAKLYNSFIKGCARKSASDHTAGETGPAQHSNITNAVVDPSAAVRADEPTGDLGATLESSASRDSRSSSGSSSAVFDSIGNPQSRSPNWERIAARAIDAAVLKCSSLPAGPQNTFDPSAAASSLSDILHKISMMNPVAPAEQTIDVPGHFRSTRNASELGPATIISNLSQSQSLQHSNSFTQNDGSSQLHECLRQESDKESEITTPKQHIVTIAEGSPSPAASGPQATSSAPTPFGGRDSAPQPHSTSAPEVTASLSKSAQQSAPTHVEDSAEETTKKTAPPSSSPNTTQPPNGYAAEESLNAGLSSPFHSPYDPFNENGISPSAPRRSVSRTRSDPLTNSDADAIPFSIPCAGVNANMEFVGFVFSGTNYMDETNYYFIDESQRVMQFGDQPENLTWINDQEISYDARDRQMFTGEHFNSEILSGSILCTYNSHLLCHMDVDGQQSHQIIMSDAVESVEREAEELEEAARVNRQRRRDDNLEDGERDGTQQNNDEGERVGNSRSQAEEEAHYANLERDGFDASAGRGAQDWRKHREYSSTKNHPSNRGKSAMLGESIAVLENVEQEQNALLTEMVGLARAQERRQSRLDATMMRVMTLTERNLEMDLARKQREAEQ